MELVGYSNAFFRKYGMEINNFWNDMVSIIINEFKRLLKFVTLSIKSLYLWLSDENVK